MVYFCTTKPHHGQVSTEKFIINLLFLVLSPGIYRKYGALVDIEHKQHKGKHKKWIFWHIPFTSLGTQSLPTTLTSSSKRVGTDKEFTCCCCQNYPRTPTFYDIQLPVMYWITILNTSIQSFQTDGTL